MRVCQLLHHTVTVLRCGSTIPQTSPCPSGTLPSQRGKRLTIARAKAAKGLTISISLGGFRVQGAPSRQGTTKRSCATKGDGGGWLDEMLKSTFVMSLGKSSLSTAPFGCLALVPNLSQVPNLLTAEYFQAGWP